jgi:hypothetical protein
MAGIVVDDPWSQFTYGGGTWGRVNAAYFLGNSATWPDFARDSNNSDTGVYGSFSFNFQGTCYIFAKVAIIAEAALNRDGRGFLWKHTAGDEFAMGLGFN